MIRAIEKDVRKGNRRRVRECSAVAIFPMPGDVSLKWSSDLVRMANRYDCDIGFRYGSKVVNAKSMLEVLSIWGKAREVGVEAKGVDAEAAVPAIQEFLVRLPLQADSSIT